MKTIKDFAAEFGVSAIARRHFAYRKPVSDREMGGYAVRGALTYMRALEKDRMGLSHLEAAKAFDQGRQLVELGIVPKLIIAGCDQRNMDGANATAEGITAAGGSFTAVFSSPAVTYPHYTGFALVQSMLAQYEDLAVHRMLAGQLQGLWSEPASVFDLRVLAAVQADYGVNGPVFFDLNFEQITLLYFRLVQKLQLNEIPFQAGAWMPKMGGGVVISADRKTAKEFAADLTIIE